ncbi:MAG: S1/P1 nuclease [Verrucomicrobia bacterium]|nr:S1/P1 nuclease [Verrucomicrobiota bacterium]
MNSKPLLTGLLAAVVITFSFQPVSVFGWGDEGHQAIALTAFDRLTPAVKTKVLALLAGEAITDAAVWPDKIRAGGHPGPLAFTPEGHAFNTNFPHNNLWHYANLPADAPKYSLTSAFTTTNDVAHGIMNCIAVLEKPGVTPHFSKHDALRWLIHLTGDIHQPLHVGCGYVTRDDNDQAHLFTAPADCTGKSSDEGGNMLHYSASQKLHAYWDGTLVDAVVSGGPTALKPVLEQKIAAAHYKNTGTYRKWAVGWASVSLKAAHGAYQGFTVGHWDADAQHRPFIHITFNDPAQYKQANTAVATEQLARAAWNLAELLNAIHWN